MRVQYPSDSSSPRAFLKAHQVLAALGAAALLTAAAGVSVGVWQLSDDSSESGAPSAPTIRIATVDELIAMNEAATEAQFGAVPSVPAAVVPSASTDELLAIHEALTSAQFGDAQTAPAAVVPSASTDELLAIHEALTDAQFEAGQAAPANDGPIYPPSREGVRGPVTVE